MEIKIELTKTPKAKPTDETKLGFGHVFTDHMFAMNYEEEKAMAPHSSTPAWKIPWTEEPGGLQSMGSHRVRDD